VCSSDLTNDRSPAAASAARSSVPASGGGRGSSRRTGFARPARPTRGARPGRPARRRRNGAGRFHRLDIRRRIGTDLCGRCHDRHRHEPRARAGRRRTRRHRRREVRSSQPRASGLDRSGRLELPLAGRGRRRAGQRANRGATGDRPFRWSRRASRRALGSRPRLRSGRASVRPSNHVRARPRFGRSNGLGLVTSHSRPFLSLSCACVALPIARSSREGIGMAFFPTVISIVSFSSAAFLPGAVVWAVARGRLRARTP
jgi:hypothetical protein